MNKRVLLLLSGAVFAGAAAGSQAETDVMAAMNAWKQATIGKDRVALERLLHDDLIFTHSGGETMTKAELLAHDMSPTYVPRTIEFSAVNVHVYGNMALVKCVVDLRSTVDGKATSAHHSVLHVWLRGPRGWQLLARQATKLAP